MGTLWPDPPALHPKVLCDHYRTHWVRADRLIDGRYGESCARELGLIAPTVRIRPDPQTGLNLLDLLPHEPEPEPEDHCDGYDR